MEDEKVGTVTRVGEMQNANKILVAKPKKNRTL